MADLSRTPQPRADGFGAMECSTFGCGLGGIKTVRPGGKSERADGGDLDGMWLGLGPFKKEDAGRRIGWAQVCWGA